MNKTKIEYLDYTWNITHGCSPVSEGCTNCYALAMSKRLAGMGVKGYEPADPFRVVFCSWKLEEPLKVKKPSRIGVSFMGDLFHDNVPVDCLWNIFEVCLSNKTHIFLLLTKRPERMRDFIKNGSLGPLFFQTDSKFPPQNIWFGVTVESPKYLWRIDELLKIPAAVHFVSIEPMLERIDLRKYLDSFRKLDSIYKTTIQNGMFNKYQVESLKEPIIDWVIAGPETGPSKRECKPEWIRDLYEQCRSAGIPFFDKTKADWIARGFPK